MYQPPEGEGRVKLVSSSVTEPISVAEAKIFLKEDESENDSLILGLITAARQMAEQYTGRLLVAGDYKIYFPAFYPVHNCKCAPVSALKLIQYYDEDDTLITWYDNDGEVKDLTKAEFIKAEYTTEPFNIRLLDGPAANYYRKDAVIFSVTGGYAAADVPKPIISAIYLIIAHLYENREDVVLGKTPADLPKGSEYLMNPYRLYEF